MPLPLLMSLGLASAHPHRAHHQLVDEVRALVIEIPAAFNVPAGAELSTTFPTGFPLATGSGLASSMDRDGKWTLYTVTDRGPNAGAPQFLEADGRVVPTKVFAAPAFQPRIVTLELDMDGRGPPRVHARESLGLVVDGVPMTGLPPEPGAVGSTGERALSPALSPLPFDPRGVDAEGIARDRHGDFWLSDEYGPSLLHVDGTTGEVKARLVPGAGLPAILASRIPNRGFEGITMTPRGRLIAVLQSVLDVDGATGSTARFIRILELDPRTGATRMFGYPLEDGHYAKAKDAKLGDVAALNDTQLLILEQGETAAGELHNSVLRVDLAHATELTGRTLTTGAHAGGALELGTAEELADVRFAKKTLLFNLRDHGWTAEKAEGLAILDDKTVAVTNDNDFGLEGTLEGATVDVTEHVVDASGTLTLGGAPAVGRYVLSRAAAAEQQLFVVRLRCSFVDAHRHP